MTLPKPSPEAAAPTHIQTLQRENARLKVTQHSGIAALVDGFPELADLCHVVADLLFLADARSGVVWDESRGNADSLSADGRSTAAGASTRAARARVSYWRRRIGDQVSAIRNDLDSGMEYRHRDIRPRCRRRGCDGYGKRQPVGVRLCGFCGEKMGNA